jgi:predicted peptidase
MTRTKPATTIAALLSLSLAAACCLVSPAAAQPQAAADAAAPPLVPGAKFTVKFPELPPTLFDLWNRQTIAPAMTVFLPRNYDPQRKHPLLIFLNGWDGGDAANPSVARALSEEQDFVCVVLPLWKESIDPAAPANTPPVIIIRDVDGKFAWPCYKTMLARLDELVRNIDPARRVIGGFSNGAHMTGELIDQSEGEAAQYFSAFFTVEGGGRTERYDLIKGKPFLMVSSNA